MTSQELRASFVDFFVARGHRQLPSATLVPHEMSTTLFTIAGMEQFVPVFLGEQPPPAPRAVTVQRCLRVAGAKSDIENVGRTGRHGTFLEMLGNFSFGDYYKREAIVFAWEWLTASLGVDPARLAVTVHADDDEAASLWQSELGLPSERITRFEEENFWTMGPSGPCGPSTEIFFDTGASYASSQADAGPNLGERFLEIWNVVFQQYNRDSSGEMHDLPRKAIDTGAGFERVLAVVNGKRSMYETDLFEDLVAAQPNGGEGEQLVRRRIIADHARAATFLVADGVYPSNVDRGYVLRFLIRRAVRNGRLLDYPKGFFAELVPAVVRSLESGYPQLRAEAGRLAAAIANEEQLFERTLERGSELLLRLIDRSKREGRETLAGTDVFTLHDTYGFPVELTREIAGEHGLAVETSEFEAAMDEQRRRARADAAAKRTTLGIADAPAARSEFLGYGGLEADGKILAIMRKDAPVPEIGSGEEATLLLDRTSFYAEKGGQIGDRGLIEAAGAVFEVSDTQFIGQAIAHHGRVREGSFRVDGAVKTRVFPHWREEIRRHHTSAHLLQRALKDVLGEEVTQAGSWVGIDRMRFDFRAPSALTAGERRAVSERVNELIREDHHLETEVVPIAEAQRRGAISMAGEQYGDEVRVVRAGPSLELCGGTHAHTTGELGMFIILSESSIGSGVRRIESVVSRAAEAHVQQQQGVLAQLSESLSATPEDIVARVARLQNELRDLQKSVGELKARLAAGDAQAYLERAEEVNGKRFVGAVVLEANAETLRRLHGAIRRHFSSGVVALIGVSDSSASALVSASDDLVARGVDAAALLRRGAVALEGRGGGNKSQAQGGGKRPAGADEALDLIRRSL